MSKIAIVGLSLGSKDFQSLANSIHQIIREMINLEWPAVVLLQKSLKDKLPELKAGLPNIQTVELKQDTSNIKKALSEARSEAVKAIDGANENTIIRAHIIAPAGKQSKAEKFAKRMLFAVLSNPS